MGFKQNFIIERNDLTKVGILFQDLASVYLKRSKAVLEGVFLSQRNITFQSLPRTKPKMLDLRQMGMQKSIWCSLDILKVDLQRMLFV